MKIRDMLKQLNKHNRSGTIAPMYLFGTEMMSAYYPKVGVKEKTVLTIAGSGDQMFDAYFRGAEKVIGFDVNRLSKYFFSFKSAAIKELSYFEFLRFFGLKPSKKVFAYEDYKRFRAHVSKESCNFFDALYKHYNHDGARVLASPFFHRRNYTVKTTAFLQSASNYQRLKELLDQKKTTFLLKDVFQVASALKKQKVDVVNLSNVPSLLTSQVFQNEEYPVQVFFDKTIRLFLPILKPRGKVFFYTYSSGVYPNSLNPVAPVIGTSKGFHALKTMRGFRLTQKRFKGWAKGLDKIIIIEKSHK